VISEWELNHPQVSKSSLLMAKTAFENYLVDVVILFGLSLDGERIIKEVWPTNCSLLSDELMVLAGKPVGDECQDFEPTG
jgi:hypothetical protein